MDDGDVLGVLAQVVASCRGTGDLRVAERRLGLAERVGPMMSFPSSAPVDLPGPGAALAGLLGRCQGDEDDWEWCRALFAAVGLDAGRLVNEAAAAVRPGLAGAYGSPVKNFLARERYRLAAVADLPFAHVPSWCDHKPVWEARERVEKRLNGWGRLVGREPVAADLRAGEHVQRLVLSGRLAPCRRHDLDAAGWGRLAGEAMLIVDDPGVWSQDLVRDLVHERHGREHESAFARVLLGLFSEPIMWDGSSPRVDNGQHRLCGARVAGVETILIGS